VTTGGAVVVTAAVVRVGALSIADEPAQPAVAASASAVSTAPVLLRIRSSRRKPDD
jgi:hypothetical protein